jgi:phage terminase large subunit
MKLKVVEESIFNIADDETKELLLATGVVPVNDKYVKLYDLPEDTNLIILIGGRGGVKTTEGSRFVSLQSSIKSKRCVILRDEKEAIKDSILNEVLLRFDEHDEHWNFSQKIERLDTGLKDKQSGQMLVFTKGFRASTKLKKANLKSVSDVDIALVEEAEDIIDPSKFDTFADSIRKQGALIIVILNTPPIGHWIVKRYFKRIHVEIKDEKGNPVEGYYDIIPRDDIPGFVCIKTSYKDNPHLPENVIQGYEAYGDPNSHKYDMHHYLTAILGYSSTGRKGQILKKVKHISLADYLSLPYKEYYGQDFGTASPAGFVGVKKHRNKVWCRQINYKPMPTLSIGKLYCQLKIHPTRDKIIADSADPKSIYKLSNGWNMDELHPDEFKIYPGLRNGWDVIGAVKGPDSIAYGLDAMIDMELYAVTESEDLWNEIENYVYAQDKFGNYTNEPVDEFNHLIDPWRYVINYLDSEAGRGGLQRVN